MLNLGPILRNDTFINNFEHKLFGLNFDSQNEKSYITFGELPED